MIQAAWLMVNTLCLGYDGFAFLEGSYRLDRSSTLPKLTTDLIISQYLFSFL
jgi:hypothetical protein